jgi:hypothetical protein
VSLVDAGGKSTTVEFVLMWLEIKILYV